MFHSQVQSKSLSLISLALIIAAALVALEFR